MEIPEKYENVTATWLFAALRVGGVIGAAEETDCAGALRQGFAIARANLR